MSTAPPIQWLDEVPTRELGNNPQPLHVVIRQRLGRVIESRFDDGQRFWSEEELSDKLKVSRVTVRRALDDLSRQGSLSRFRAKGTFVRKSAQSPVIAPVAVPAPSVAAAYPFKSVGVFAAQYNSQFSIDFIDEFSAVAAERGLDFHVYRTHRGDTGTQAVEQLNAPAIDEAIILFANEPSLTREMYCTLSANGYKLITVDVVIPDIPAAYVGTNNDMGIRLALRHLMDLGHSRILFMLSEPEDLIVPQARLSSFNAVAREQRATEMRAVSAGVRLWDDPDQAAYAMMPRVWADEVHRPTAIVCASDAGAAGVLRWCNENRISVPADLSVVGFDDDRSSRYMNPPLTTVAHPKANIARRAVEILAGGEQSHEFLPPTLVIRATTAAPCTQQPREAEVSLSSKGQ
ncbi:MAG TPA: substrate-binding domain-containing protein [Capsulimonadaceae bacterium]|jgi:DNA-binding LacI/PurR family transcriptional regulator